MADKVDSNQKKIEAGIANLSAVIKSLSSNKKGIIKATSDLNEIIKIAAAAADALNSPDAKKAVTVATNISTVLGAIVDMTNAMTKPIKTINKVSTVSLAKARLKIKAIGATINTIVKFATSIKTDINSVIKRIQDIIKMLKTLDNMFVTIHKIKTTLVKRKVRKITGIITELKVLVKATIQLGKYKGISETPKKMKDILAMMTVLKEIINTIRSTRTTGMDRKGKRIDKAVKAIETLVGKLTAMADGIKNVKSTNKKLDEIKSIFSSFKSIMISALIIMPLSLVFVMAAPILLVCIWAAGTVMKLLIRVMVHMMKSPMMLIATVVIAGLVAFNAALVILALSLLVLGLVAIPALMTIPFVLIFMVGLIGLILLFAAFGAITTLAWPALAAGVLGVALVTIAVLCIVVIALLLLLLQTLELDIEKIKENVKKVLATATQIILWVAEPLDEDEQFGQPGEKPAPGIFDIIGHGFMKIVGAVLAVAILLPVLIAVAAIVLMAGLLRLLQNLDLDYSRIHDNVQAVLDCAKWILEFVTEPTKGRFDNPHKDDLLTSLAGFVYKPILKVVDMIAAMLTLAVMVVAILAILLVATMLRLLQNLDLDENKIMANVEMVLQTSRTIINHVFKADDEEKSESDRSVLGSLLGWIYEPIVPILDAVFALAYLAVMVIAVLCLWGIAKLLQFIQDLELNENKIAANTDKIMGLVKHITNIIFGRDDEYSEPSDRGVIGGFLHWVSEKLSLDGLFAVIDAVFTLAYLAVMVIAVLCLLGIAKLLEIIGELDIDERKIMKNVSAVISTVKNIVELIFYKDDENDDGSSRNPIAAFIKWVCDHMGLTQLGKVIEAIFTLAYLAVMMIAILCVLGIAKLLELVGEIPTDVMERAKVNASLAVSTCTHIANLIYNPDEEDQSKSERGGILSFIRWVSPEIGAIMDAILTIAYLALMLVAMVIVLGLVKIMKQIGEIDRSIMDNAFSIVELVMLTCNNIVNKVYDGEDEGSESSNRGALLTIIEWVAGKRVADLLSAILTIAYLALMFFAIYIVAAIAKSLEEIGKIERDDIIKARDNVDLVMSTAVFVMNKVMNGDYELPEAEGGGPLETLLKWLLPDDLVAIVKAIMTIGSLSFAEVMIGVLARIATNIASIGEIDTSIIDVAKTNATKIINASGEILKLMSDNIGGLFEDEDEFETIASVIKGLAGTVDSMAKIGKSLETISKQPDFNMEKAVTNTIKTYQGCLTIIEAIAQPAGEKQGTTPLDALVNAISPGAALMSDATWMIFEQYEAYAKRIESLGKVIKAASTAMKNLSGLMKSLPDLYKAMGEVQNSTTPNMQKITARINALFDTTQHLVDKVYQVVCQKGPEEVANREGELNDAITRVGQQTKLFKSLDKMILAVCGVMRHIRSLSTWFPVIAGLDLKSDVMSNINIMFNSMYKIIKLAVRGTDEDGWDELSSKASKAGKTANNVANLLNSYVSIVPIIQSMADAIAGLNIDVDKIQSNAARAKESLNYMFSVIKAASIPVKNQLVRDNMDLMDRINESITSFTHVSAQDVKNSKDLTDNYIAFLTKVNSMDYTKLKTTEQLMKHWAEMSKSINGNFQGLAQAINEHIMPALNNLNKTMDESMKVQKQIIDDLSKPIDGSNIVAGSGSGETQTGSSATTTTTTTTTTSTPGNGAANKTTKTETGAGDIYEIEENSDENLGRESKNNEPIGDSLSSFINPYGPINKRKKSPLEAALEGDVIRVKIVN